MKREAKEYEVSVNGYTYRTYAISGNKARNNIRYRENLMYVPLENFYVRKVDRNVI